MGALAGLIVNNVVAPLVKAKVEGKAVGLVASKTAHGAVLAGGATALWAPLVGLAVQSVAGPLGLSLDATAVQHVTAELLQAAGTLYALYGYLHARKSMAKAS